MIIKKEEKDWKFDNIQAFWDWFGQNQYLQNKYFSKQVGKGIINLLVQANIFKGKLLDYGCGPGYLLENILSYKEIEAYGFEFSEESVKLLNRKFRNFSNFKGVKSSKQLPTPYESDYFDLITAIEMIEHLKEESIQPVFNELKRLIKPNGIVLITTPNNENIDANMIFCPFCNSEFHRVQHMRAFDESSLNQLLNNLGFEILFCKAIDLQKFQKKHIRITDLTLYQIYILLKERLDKFKYILFEKNKRFGYLLDKKYDNPRHLIALVTKKV